MLQKYWLRLFYLIKPHRMRSYLREHVQSAVWMCIRRDLRMCFLPTFLKYPASLKIDRTTRHHYFVDWTFCLLKKQRHLKRRKNTCHRYLVFFTLLLGYPFHPFNQNSVVFMKWCIKTKRKDQNKRLPLFFKLVFIDYQLGRAFTIVRTMLSL